MLPNTDCLLCHIKVIPVDEEVRQARILLIPPTLLTPALLSAQYGLPEYSPTILKLILPEISFALPPRPPNTLITIRRFPTRKAPHRRILLQDVKMVTRDSD